MPFVRCQDPPLSFLDWATPPHRTDAKAKGVAEKAQPIASPPTTSQKDQGGARPTLNRGGQTQESKAITKKTKAVYKPAKRQSPPPSLYIPPSPRSYDKVPTRGECDSQSDDVQGPLHFLPWGLQ